MIFTGDLPICLLSFSAAGHALSQRLCLVSAQAGCQRCQWQASETIPLVPAKDIGLAKEESISSPEPQLGILLNLFCALQQLC